MLCPPPVEKNNSFDELNYPFFKAQMKKENHMYYTLIQK